MIARLIGRVNPMRTAVFAFIAVAALALGAMGIYSADAASDSIDADGYGITASIR